MLHSKPRHSKVEDLVNVLRNRMSQLGLQSSFGPSKHVSRECPPTVEPDKIICWVRLYDNWLLVGVLSYHQGFETASGAIQSRR